MGVLLRVRRYPLNGQEKAVVREAGVTAMLGYLCFLLAGFLLCGKLADPTLGGVRPGSYSLLAALAALCAVTGGFVLLWCYMKKSVAYADRLVQVSGWDAPARSGERGAAGEGAHDEPNGRSSAPKAKSWRSTATRSSTNALLKRCAGWYPSMGSDTLAQLAARL